jgi:hypothetical protein
VSGTIKQQSKIEAEQRVAQMRKTHAHYNESPDKPFEVDMVPTPRNLPVKLMSIEDWGRMKKGRLPPSMKRW